MNAAAEVVVIAHGLWMPGLETLLLRRRLAAAGFRPVLYRYPTVRATLTENIGRFAEFVAAMPEETVHRIGYSLGGVVAVAAAQSFPEGPAGRIVCLGAPLNGTRAGATLARSRLGAAIVGRSIGELNARGGLDPWRGSTEIACIAGSRALGMGRAVAALAGANDGTVAVAETLLTGIGAHLVLPVTHTTMLFSPAVAAAAVSFLRHGAFR